MYVTHNCYILIRGNSLEEITEEALHYAYFYLTRSLVEHRAQGKNGEYEAFALQVLALLQEYRHVYTCPPEAPSPD
jgi:hypothetical protein